MADSLSFSPEPHQDLFGVAAAFLSHHMRFIAARLAQRNTARSDIIPSMSLNRYARRKDANKDELVDAYRKAGWFIYESEKPLDLLGFKYFWFVIEVKIRTGRYTKAQEKFLREAPAMPLF